MASGRIMRVCRLLGLGAGALLSLPGIARAEPAPTPAFVSGIGGALRAGSAGVFPGLAMRAGVLWGGPARYHLVAFDLIGFAYTDLSGAVHLSSEMHRTLRYEARWVQAHSIRWSTYAGAGAGVGFDGYGVPVFLTFGEPIAESGGVVGHGTLGLWLRRPERLVEFYVEGSVELPSWQTRVWGPGQDGESWLPTGLLRIGAVLRPRHRPSVTDQSLQP